MVETRGRRRAGRAPRLVERPPTAADRSRPPTPRQWVTPMSASSSRASTCWAPCRRRRRCRPVRVARRWRSRARLRRRPRSRSRAPSRAAVARRALLEGDLGSSDTLSLKIITSRPASRASAASMAATRPGVLTNARSASTRRAAAPIVGAGGRPASAAPDTAGRRASASSRAATAAVSAVSSAARRHHHVVRAGVGWEVEAQLGEQVEVELGGHRDEGLADVGAVLDLPADQHQADRVVVGAAANLNGGAHAAYSAGPGATRSARLRAGRDRTRADRVEPTRHGDRDRTEAHGGDVVGELVDAVAAGGQPEQRSRGRGGPRLERGGEPARPARRSADGRRREQHEGATGDIVGVRRQAVAATEVTPTNRRQTSRGGVVDQRVRGGGQRAVAAPTSA